jgi:energy-converting hydrogenase Eha subunit A
MARLPQRFDRRRDSAAPVLLPTFTLAVMAIVLAVVVIGRTGSDLADVGAVVLLLAAVAALGVAIGRRLDDQEPDTPDQPTEEQRR